MKKFKFGDGEFMGLCIWLMAGALIIEVIYVAYQVARR